MRAELRFYAELRDFLPAPASGGTITHTFDVPGSVKDAIERYGVPHTEVDVVLANGESVDFSYRVADGDRISVYPVFEAFDVSPVVRLRPRPLRRVRFVVDGHLGKLAGYLRLLGFDTRCDDAWADHELVAISVDEHRILLTRDVGLLKHAAVTHGCYVRSVVPREQLVEIVSRFHLAELIDPFTRCMACNGELALVAKEEVADRLQPGTLAHHDEFSTCAACERVYWRGSHHSALSEIVAEARAAG